MTSIIMQRDLVVTLKKETLSNIGILSKLIPMPADLSRLIFKDNALEKLFQSVFNHLSHYLISIIDANVCASFTWPLYDTKGERAYRNEIAAFISDYSRKGLLSPVMSSYLVKPGCFKVTMLLFQLSQLAVNRMLNSVMERDSQIQLYREMTERYQSQQKEGFVECMETETERMLSKYSLYVHKRKVVEEIAERFRAKIESMEKKTSHAKKYLNNLVDGVVKLHGKDDKIKQEILKIKNVYEQSKIFDCWLAHVDATMDSMEATWGSKASTFLESCQTLQQSTEALISRHTGERDRSTYTVEYNHKTDKICTRDLQNQVNSEQKYVLLNLERDEKLIFPNLVRAFVISISFILKNNDIGDEIYRFNEYLEGGTRNYAEIASTLRLLNERMINAEEKLQPLSSPCSRSLFVKELPDIPDISNLKASIDPTQILSSNFTPLHLSKYQFNLQRKNSVNFFARPLPKSLITPFHVAPRSDFMKGVISCRISSYDQQTESHNVSTIHMNRGNETIAECSGFTRQQLTRLLSTKKSSSSKKFKYSTERPNINIKKGGLFNESVSSNESSGLFRSYSSPNLFENREKRCLTKLKGKKLSIMREDSPMSILEMSGITALDKEINFATPPDHAESSRKEIDSSNILDIRDIVTSDAQKRLKNIVNEIDFDKEMGIENIVSPILEEPRKSIEIEKLEVKEETPKTNTRLKLKPSSLERIINRFKKVRAYNLPEKKETCTDIKTIIEEKENIKSVNSNMFNVNRNILPDLLSQSPRNESGATNTSETDYLDKIFTDIDKVESRKPRQSLGAALGVDHTFLDQFDLID